MPTLDCALAQAGGQSADPTNVVSEQNREFLNLVSSARMYLFRPDVSGIPAGATVTSASLRIRSAFQFASGAFDVYENLRTWVTGECSWNDYSTGNAWATAGGSGSGSDRSASSIGTQTTNTADTDVWYDVALTPAIVQDWCDEVRSNGMQIVNGSGFDGVLLGVPTATLDPVLRVNYTEAASLVGSLGQWDPELRLSAWF